MSKVQLRKLHKSFDGVLAVDSLDLEIGQGEFFSLLGPSGCGKTTTLRMVAGFERPTSGEIFFDGRDVTFLKPSSRNTGMVFQNFALFPNMTVYENVAFGLQARKRPRSEIRRRVEKALDLVDLQAQTSRSVTQLSGGQQQRVALARAIVIEPNILLLDEPLSNLDARLRLETRAEIKSLQRRLGITTIYVTHDQDEALSLSDRIAVLNRGVCQQVGAPAEIYQQPANAFVAKFVGNSNVFGARLHPDGEGQALAIGPTWRLKFVEPWPGGEKDVAVSIRPEDVRFVESGDGLENAFAAKLLQVNFGGSMVDYELDVHGQRLRAKGLVQPADFERVAGSEVFVHIPPANIRVLPR